MSELKVFSLKKTKSKSEKPNNDHILPSHPARVLFSGPSGSGKTNLIVWLLNNRAAFRNYFHKIYLFSPNVHADDTFDLLDHYDDVLETFDEFDPDELEEQYELHKTFVEVLGKATSPRVLWLFDDMLGESKISNSDIMKKLFVKGRHVNGSVWFSTQSYMNVNRSWRLQLSNIMVFSPDEGEAIRIAKEGRLPNVKSRRLDKIISDATKKRFNFLHIDRKNLQYTHNFDYVYDS